MRLMEKKGQAWHEVGGWVIAIIVLLAMIFVIFLASKQFDFNLLNKLM